VTYSRQVVKVTVQRTQYTIRYKLQHVPLAGTFQQTTVWSVSRNKVSVARLLSVVGLLTKLVPVSTLSSKLKHDERHCQQQVDVRHQQTSCDTGRQLVVDHNDLVDRCSNNVHVDLLRRCTQRPTHCL